MLTVNDVQSIVEFSISSFHNRTPIAAALLKKKIRACILL